MIDKHNNVIIDFDLGEKTSQGGGTKFERKFSVDENGKEKQIAEYIADEL